MSSVRWVTWGWNVRPKRTTYHLATEPEHFRMCRNLWKAVIEREPELGPVKRFGWPTVFGIRDGKVVGFLSTTRKSNLPLIAGPLVLAPGQGAITALRLVESYERVLLVAGVDHYLFGTTNDLIRSAIERVGREELGIGQVIQKGGATWYVKRVPQAEAFDGEDRDLGDSE